MSYYFLETLREVEDGFLAAQDSNSRCNAHRVD